MGIYTKVSGTWRRTDWRTKVSGTWRNTDPYVKVGGVWKPLYPDITGGRTAQQFDESGGGTWAGQSIGSAALNRLLVIAFSCENTTATPTFTVDGVAATPVAIGSYTASTPDLLAVIYQIPKPTGTTATIAFSMSGSGNWMWGCWALYTENHTVYDNYAAGTAPGSDSISGAINAADGGAIITAVVAHDDINSFTPIGCTEAIDVGVAGGGSTRHFEGYVIPTAAQVGRVVGADNGNGVVKAIATASWNRL